MTRRSRRDLLSGVGAGGVAGLTLLAGCTGLLGGDGGDGDDQGDGTPTDDGDGDGGTPDDDGGGGDDGLPPLDGPVFDAWVPPTESVESGRQFYTVEYTSLDAVGTHETALSSAVVEDAARRRTEIERRYGGDGDAVESTLVGEGFDVHVGSFSPDAVARRLTNYRDFEHSGSHGGYEVYAAGEAVAVGVAGDALVVSRQRDGPVSVVETAIDARTGDGDRQSATDPGYGTAIGPFDGVDALEVTAFPPLQAEGSPHRAVVGLTRVGTGWTFDTDRTNLTRVYVFETAGDVDPDGFEEYLHSPKAEVSDYDDLTVEATDGRVVRASGSIATGDYDRLSRFEEARDPPSPPEANFEFDHYDSTARVTHAGGEVFNRYNTIRLEALVDGEVGTSLGLPVLTGDGTEVEAESGTEVSVRWVGPVESRTIATYDVP